MKKVLLVDDEKNFLVKLEAGLAEYETDFSVLTAENGEQAVDILQSTAIDLVVTDLRMPVMDGFELLAYVASNFPTIPVIIMTAFGTPEVERELNASGILTLIEKPIDLDDLAHAIIQGLETTAEEGALTGISLDSFVQLIEMEQKTCLLEIQAEGKKTSYLLFNEGELYDAIADQLKGEDAAHEIIGLRNVKIRFMKLPPRRKLKRRIDKPLMSILMEAKRLEDESHDTRNQEEALEDWAFDDDDIPPDDLILLEEELLLEDGEKSEDQKEVDALSPDTVSAGDASEEEDDPGKEDGAEEEIDRFENLENTRELAEESNETMEGGEPTTFTTESPSGPDEKEGREASESIISKGGNQMALKDVLQQMSEEIDGLVVVAVAGMDGLVLGEVNPGGAKTEFFGARFAMVTKLELNICNESDKMGVLQENIMEAEHLWIFTQVLGPSYYLAIALSKQQGTLGMVRMVARKYESKLKESLGVS
jgi:CheY-like chemotaxis protein